MVKIRIGDGSGSERLFVPAQRDVKLYLQDAEFMEADREKGYGDRVRWDFELVDGPDLDDELVGKVFPVYTNLPGPGKDVHPRSNLYKILEGVSGGTFDPGDEIDTDIYVGKDFIGDFHLVNQQERIPGSEPARFRDKVDPQSGKTIKKSELTNIHPPRPAKPERAPRSRRQETFDWDGEDDAAE